VTVRKGTEGDPGSAVRMVRCEADRQASQEAN
jgi:hypothetical protein